MGSFPLVKVKVLRVLQKGIFYRLVCGVKDLRLAGI
jgi:hypothetical protein